jgi:hypothetical protein
MRMLAYVRIRPHTTAYVSIRIRQHSCNAPEFVSLVSAPRINTELCVNAWGIPLPTAPKKKNLYVNKKKNPAVHTMHRSIIKKVLYAELAATF